MNALLVVAHGSRRKESNEEVIALAEKLKAGSSGQFSIVQAAFLELTNPLIPEGIEICVKEGANSIVVLPYFLNSGRHVIEDIPGIVAECRLINRQIDISILPHIGSSDQMMNLMIDSANRAGLSH